MSSKIISATPSELELQVAQGLLDLENSSSDLKSELRPLQIKSVREIDVGAGKRAIAVFVPVASLAGFQRVHKRFVISLLFFT